MIVYILKFAVNNSSHRLRVMGAVSDFDHQIFIDAATFSGAHHPQLIRSYRLMRSLVFVSNSISLCWYELEQTHSCLYTKLPCEYLTH